MLENKKELDLQIEVMLSEFNRRVSLIEESGLSLEYVGGDGVDRLILLSFKKIMPNQKNVSWEDLSAEVQYVAVCFLKKLLMGKLDKFTAYWDEHSMFETMLMVEKTSPSGLFHYQYLVSKDFLSTSKDFKASAEVLSNGF